LPSLAFWQPRVSVGNESAAPNSGCRPFLQANGQQGSPVAEHRSPATTDVAGLAAGQRMETLLFQNGSSHANSCILQRHAVFANQEM
jgi:hypothetical protein